MAQDAFRGGVVFYPIVVADGTDLATPLCNACDLVSVATTTLHVRERDCVVRFRAAAVAREAVGCGLVVIVVTRLAQCLRWKHGRRLVANGASQICRPMRVVREQTDRVLDGGYGCSTRTFVARGAVQLSNLPMVTTIAGGCSRQRCLSMLFE